MFKNYLKIAMRNIARHKAFAAINILGLAIGMACSIFILLWVKHELSYDTFHRNANNIYRIVVSAGDFDAAVNPGVMPPGLKEKLPAIKNFVRFSHPAKNVFEAGTKRFEEQDIFFADSTLLQVFNFPLVKGNPATALMRPDAVLLTEDMAKKYFGDQDPMGKVLKKNNSSNVVVTGVLKNIPANSHLHFNFIMPISAIAATDNDLANNRWDNFNFYNYLLVDQNVSSSPEALAALTQKINNVYKEHVDEKAFKVDFHLQPLTDIHLHSKLQVDLPGHGNIQYVKIFFVVALFILAVACINFMNLATARSARRAKEVGLRKVVGAGRKHLIAQFLGESLIISFIALTVAMAIVFALLPLFSQLAGNELSVQLMDRQTIAILVSIAVGAGLLSGSYPALFLSGFQPIKVLKGNLKNTGSNLFFRNGLVVVQFVVSIVLLAGTAVVYSQLSYIKNMNLGFEKSNLLYMHMTGEMWSHQDALKAMLKQNPLTADYTITNELPINLSTGTINVKWEGKDPNNQIVFPNLFVDENFVKVLKLNMLYGRSFSNNYKADSNNYIVNEKALQVMGMKAHEAVGKPLIMFGIKGAIIGVVKDFNFKPIQQPIEPLIMGLNKGGGSIVVRTKPGNTEASIKALENINTQINTFFPFSFGFFDQDLASMYKSEQRMSNLFNLFAVLAIFISCLGLYGLSAFLAEQRTREIGVRKVLGASVFNVVYLLSTGFTRLILISVVIGVPLAWLVINNWLQGFAYRIEINWVIFLAASLVSLLIAWITVSYESVKAAIANPVKSLRAE